MAVLELTEPVSPRNPLVPSRQMPTPKSSSLPAERFHAAREPANTERHDNERSQALRQGKNLREHKLMQSLEAKQRSRNATLHASNMRKASLKHASSAGGIRSTLYETADSGIGKGSRYSSQDSGKHRHTQLTAVNSEEDRNAQVVSVQRMAADVIKIVDEAQAAEKDRRKSR